MAVIFKRLRIIPCTITALVLLFIGIDSLWHYFDVQEEHKVYTYENKRIQKHKPLREERHYLADIKDLNEDVIGWISLSGTEIDQPVVQGDDNSTYLYQNIYKEYSISGSLFMDVRCNPLFTDSYQLIYGHHMSNHEMLADLDEYLEQDFFKTNTKGILYTDTEKMNLHTIAVMEVSYDDPWIYHPVQTNEDMYSFTDYIYETALYIDEGTMEEVYNFPYDYPVIALSTCSRTSEDERIVLLLTTEDQVS